MHSHSKQLPTNLGCHCRVGQTYCLVVFHNLFCLFNLSLSFLKFLLYSCVPPALRAHSDRFMSTLACVAKEVKLYFRLPTSSRVRKIRTTQVPSTRIRIFSNRNFFFPDTATVLTYPANSTANPEKK